MRPTDQHTDQHTGLGSPAGPESWVAQAVAQQEEHLRRQRPCEVTSGPHSWDYFARRPKVRIRACWRCGVTATDEDYQRGLPAHP